MAADEVDDWLYGEVITETTDPVSIKEEPEDESIKENGRPSTPTLDDMESASLLGFVAPSQVPTGKIVSNAPDLQPKVTTPSDEAKAIDDGEDVEGGEGEEEDDSESDEDDVQIHIGEIQTTTPIAYGRAPNYGRMSLTTGGAVVSAQQTKKVDIDGVPQINGQPLFDIDLDAAALDKPWRMPGADITDYFNYGFTEETWRFYCDKQRKMRAEVQQLNKIAVHASRVTTIPSAINTAIHRVIPSIGIPPATLPPHHPSLLHVPRPAVHIVPPSLPAISLANTIEDRMMEDTDGAQTKDDASDGRATPGLEQNEDSGTPKGPLLPPPPSLPPPPLPFPPPNIHSQDSIAAMMAAAMLGGMRPPDHMHHFPPPMHPHLPPPFHLGPHDGMPHFPFPGMPPPLPVPGMEHHGPPLDERGMPIPPELLGPGAGFPWDPSLGPPPPELFEGVPLRDMRGRSSLRSRSSSFSRGSHSRSRSSSYDDKRGRRRERRNRRHSRSRSRSRDRDRDRERERDRHRSSRHHRDHHRSDRHERERDRDKERDRDRDRDRERDRERRRRDRDERSRHERSRRHRSSSRGDREEERSSRKEKKEEKAREEEREDKSKSGTPPG